MDGPAERACLVLGVSLHYADTFSPSIGRCSWQTNPHVVVSARTQKFKGASAVKLLRPLKPSRKVFELVFSLRLRCSKFCPSLFCCLPNLRSRSRRHYPFLFANRFTAPIHTA